MTLFIQAVRVATGRDEDGMLVFDDDHRLRAVLTRLTDQHDGVSGYWFLETGYGRLDGPDHPTFADLDEAQHWISLPYEDALERLGRSITPASRKSR